MRFFAAGIVLCMAAGAWGQSGRNSLPVDQATSDLDPLATSLRRMEPGNAMFSHHVRLQRLDGATALDPVTGLVLPRQYVFRTPGVRAFLNRPDYVVLSPFSTDDEPLFDRNVAPGLDGALIEVLPANTVFDLVPRLLEIEGAEEPHGPAYRGLPDLRMDYRINTRVNTRMDRRVDTAVNRSSCLSAPPDWWRDPIDSFGRRSTTVGRLSQIPAGSDPGVAATSPGRAKDLADQVVRDP